MKLMARAVLPPFWAASTVVQEVRVTVQTVRERQPAEALSAARTAPWAFSTRRDATAVPQSQPASFPVMRSEPELWA